MPPRPGAASSSRPGCSEARPGVCGSPRNRPSPTICAMPAQKIRCGVAGVGSLGQHHARIYASTPGAELTGIYDTSDARAAEISAKLGCRKFASLEALGEACDAAANLLGGHGADR